jgi:peptidoglycan/xylan/chitin deacetylase (PgdA/CDA1 family)
MRVSRSGTISRAVYLAFDDFPTVRESQPADPSDDELLLDILRARHIPATFFCIGEHLFMPESAKRATPCRNC